MDNLLITKTKSTLGVDFSVQGGLLNIEGSSYPENTRDFFEPLIAWINNSCSKKLPRLHSIARSTI